MTLRRSNVANFSQLIIWLYSDNQCQQGVARLKYVKSTSRILFIIARRRILQACSFRRDLFYLIFAGLELSWPEKIVDELDTESEKTDYNCFQSENSFIVIIITSKLINLNLLASPQPIRQFCVRGTLLYLHGVYLQSGEIFCAIE